MKEQDLRDKFGNLDTVIISDCGDRQMCIPNGKMTENTTDKCVQIAKDYAEKEAIEFAMSISTHCYCELGNDTRSYKELYQLFKNRENER